MPGSLVTINSRRFDGSIKRSWNCELIGRKDYLLTFVGEFEHDVKHSELGLIKKGTVSYEYYWLDRWYNVFRFCEPDGSLRNYYCNINAPPSFEDGVLDYVDLDIDLVIWPDGRIQVLDEADFEENSKMFAYPENILRKVREALDELHGMIESGELPAGN